MTPNPNGLPEIHVFEPSGYGGVFQHTCQLGQGLSRHGRQVVLHTGHQHEEVHLDGVEVCACSWWPRPRAGGRIRTGLRQATIARRLVQRTMPHLLRSAPPGAVLHLQGIAATGALNLLILSAVRRAGHRVVYSPHDMFSRRGPVDGVMLRLAYRAPHAIMVHSRADEERIKCVVGDEVGIYFSPLVQLVPRPSDSARMSWRREWRADGSEEVVLFAGFVRPEKRLDVLIESARRWPPGRRLAVVGPDRGGWAQCGHLAQTCDVDIAARLEFVELAEFTAAIAAADLVVVPSERASQSGVLALARQLRTPSIAADVGGLGELASRTFTAGDADNLSRAIQAELSNGHRNGSALVEPLTEENEAVQAHLRAYGQLT